MERYCEESILRNVLVGLPTENEVMNDEFEFMGAFSDSTHSSLVRCYGYTCESTKRDVSGDFSVCRKLTNYRTYLNLNAFVMSQFNRDNIIENSNIIADTVTIKQSSVGKDVKVGIETKINNSIVMDKAEIGCRVMIQNSILCEGVKIGASCSINDCVIGRDIVIAQGSKMKGEIKFNQ